jgi:hypothetical protein
MIKRIIGQIPLYTALILIIGIIRLTLYYQNFSVPIKYYIGFSEIATSIADDLLLFLLFYGLLKGIEILVKDMRPGLGSSMNEKTSHIFPIIMILGNTGLFVWNLLEKEYYLRLVCLTLIYFLLFISILGTKFAKEFISRNKDVAFILFFFILTLVNMVISTSSEIRRVSRGKFAATRIITNDSTYISNDTSYFIGQTEKYVFFYYASKHCLIIPTSTVKILDIRIRQ